MELIATSLSDDYLKRLGEIVGQAKTRRQWEEAIVNAPFYNPRVTGLLGLGIVVLLLVNKQTDTIDRITLTNNEMTRGAFRMTAVPFKEIKIPLNYTKNFIAKAIAERHYTITSDWQFIMEPALTPEQAHFNQAGSGIACSVIYPLPRVLDGGAMIFSYYEPIERIGKEHHGFMHRYVTIAQKSFANLEKAARKK